MSAFEAAGLVLLALAALILVAWYRAVIGHGKGEAHAHRSGR